MATSGMAAILVVAVVVVAPGNPIRHPSSQLATVMTSISRHRGTRTLT